jgi:hypothetical protein
MENTTIDQQNASDQVYAFAANMMLQQDKNTYETKIYRESWYNCLRSYNIWRYSIY